MSTNHVEHAATIRCQFGTTTAELCTSSTKAPIATVSDFVPLVNIYPFGACLCASNPAVAAATTAAGGVPTPAPCVPVVEEPWLPGSSKVTVLGVSGLAPDSTARCRWGGVIALVLPIGGQRGR